MKKSEIRLIITAIITLVLAVICGLITIITFFGSLVDASKSIEFEKWTEGISESVSEFTSIVDENSVQEMVDDFNEGISDIQQAYDITAG
ncbi:MAG: hypothetical protein MJ094_06165 [Saccharofermentans sp.]|nr:hypothetical protein [Saccharofermentans sp.]